MRIGMVEVTNSYPIMVITGAGISAESGIPTFRDADGLWENHNVDDVATPEGFKKNPELVHRFYNQRRANLQNPAIQPNDAHRAVARLQQEWKGKVHLVTQNVDNLHERGGSKALIHVHGELLKARCQLCDWNDVWTADLGTEVPCPDCGMTGAMRPDVVWFGEMAPRYEDLYDVFAASAIMICIGTSGQVLPTGRFAQTFRKNGGATIQSNLNETFDSDEFDVLVEGPATKAVPHLVDRLLSGAGFPSTDHRTVRVSVPR
jgi:NAD-dependent deacetylase